MVVVFRIVEEVWVEVEVVKKVVEEVMNEVFDYCDIVLKLEFFDEVGF